MRRAIRSRSPDEHTAETRLNSDFLGLVLILPTGGLRWGQRAMLPGGVRGGQRCAGEHENEESLARLIQVQLVQVLCGIRQVA